MNLTDELMQLDEVKDANRKTSDCQLVKWTYNNDKITKQNIFIKISVIILLFYNYFNFYFKGKHILYLKISNCQIQRLKHFNSQDRIMMNLYIEILIIIMIIFYTFLIVIKFLFKCNTIKC